MMYTNMYRNIMVYQKYIRLYASSDPKAVEVPTHNQSGRVSYPVAVTFYMGQYGLYLGTNILKTLGSILYIVCTHTGETEVS